MHSFSLNTSLKTNNNKKNNKINWLWCWRNLQKIWNKSHKFSALNAKLKTEGSSELVVSPASLIMHIFNRRNRFLRTRFSARHFVGRRRRELFMGVQQFVWRRAQWVKIQFCWSQVHCFYVPQKSLLLFLKKIQASFLCKRQMCWPVHWTEQAPCFSWSKWPCIVHGQSALCFFCVSSTAEPKVNSWPEALQSLYSSCSRTDCQWCELQLFLFTTTDFVFCKPGALLFLHHWDTMSY